MTTFDNKANFIYSTVLIAPSPATTGTTLSVQVVDGANFPDPTTYNYNLVVFPADTYPTVANAEVVRVTAKSSNQLTITRGQEGTSARTILVGDQVMLAPTAKTLTDIETAIGTIETWKESITSSVAELNLLDGVTSTTAELNILDGVTANKDEINKLDGVVGDVVGTTDTQTLTNKTLTSPTINTPTTTLANNVAIKAKDSGGTARDVIKVDSSDILQIGSGSLKGIQFESDMEKPIYYYLSQSSTNHAYGDAAKHNVTGYALTITLVKACDLLLELNGAYKNNDVYGYALHITKDGGATSDFSVALRAGMATNSLFYYDQFLYENLAAGTYTFQAQLAASGSTSANMDLLRKCMKISLVEKR